MNRRPSIPNEASLTALEILELTTQQYSKNRKGSPAAAAFGGSNGNVKIKTAKPSPRQRAGARKTAPARSAKKS